MEEQERQAIGDWDRKQGRKIDADTASYASLSEDARTVF